jgi:hypothetical protein
MIELSFHIDPDENGMIDGLQLASQLIAVAARLINPYVNKCPGCLDAVFSHLANHELATLHQLVKQGTGPDGTAILYCFADEKNRDVIIKEAITAASPVVEEIVQAASVGHVHH